MTGAGGRLDDDGSDAGGNGASSRVSGGRDTSRGADTLSLRVLDVGAFSRRTRLGDKSVRLLVTRPPFCALSGEAAGDGELCGLLEIVKELLKSPFALGVAVAAGMALGFAFAVPATALLETALFISAASATVLFASTATVSADSTAGVVVSIIVCETVGEASTLRLAAFCAHNIHNKPVPATDISGKLRVQNVG